MKQLLFFAAFGAELSAGSQLRAAILAAGDLIGTALGAEL